MMLSPTTWDILVVPWVLVAGTLAHFCFEWSGQRRILALVCPVNESVWEHVKMPYLAVLVATGVQFAAGQAPAALPSARALGFTTMSVAMLGLFYLTGHALPGLGIRARLVLDGCIFVAAVVIGQLVCHLALGALTTSALVGFALLIAPVAVFAVTTFTPPRWELFKDQLTGRYGIPSKL
ncbi:hypothetical protein GR927_40645 [Mycolicibacterium sp. 3033]|nr:hypothetical protein [Mycolicibacterium aurantiacum]